MRPVCVVVRCVFSEDGREVPFTSAVTMNVYRVGDTPSGVRLETVPFRLTTAHLRQLLADGGQPAGPSPIPLGAAEPGTAIEVDRLVRATAVGTWSCSSRPRSTVSLTSIVTVAPP